MEEIRAPKNFIEEFIEEDIKEKGLTHIQTRFPPEPNGYLAAATCATTTPTPPRRTRNSWTPYRRT